MNADAYQIHLNHFIEEMATILESEGLPRMVGRVFGYLLVCEPRQQSSAELADALGASRGAISMATRSLLQAGLVRRTRVPGSRASYFEIPDDAPDQLLHGAVARLKIFGGVLQNQIDLMQASGKPSVGRLRSFREAYAFMEKEFPAMLERWDAQKEES